MQRITDNTKPLRVYIEGDGRAYIDKYTPSFNPTPVSEFLLDVISRDNSPNLIYIARPCQYVDSSNCREEYWTSKRFSTEVIDSISAVINKFPDYEIELIGYSGGATIINHLNIKNVRNIRTIAGNLDLKTFTRFHRVAELEEPIIDYARIARIPQIHFVGKQDKIIPVDIFNSYKHNLPKKNCTRLIKLKNATHYEGWEDQWYSLLQIKLPVCEEAYPIQAKNNSSS